MAAASSIARFLEAEQRKELLRFTTAGSVDDGKSTLIGRLLYDSKGVYEDQLTSVQKASVNRNAGPIDFSLLTDGLRAEREQGITIDVAYRYFSTPKRKFIIADTPGHEQYTRNMATGASTAELAIVLVDARKGVLPQSRRHAFIAALLGIPSVVVAVNKMDLVDFSPEVFAAIEAEFRDFVRDLGIRRLHFIPISALEGDNVVSESPRTPWYRGGSLLHYLETVPVDGGSKDAPLRFPVQTILRPTLDFRGYAGQIASGSVRVGDEVLALPSGRKSRVKSIVTFDGDLPEASAPRSVTLTLEDEIDISRGDVVVASDFPPHASRTFAANVVWMSADPLLPGKPYLVKHTTQQAPATVIAIEHRVDVNTLARVPAETLQLNEIGVVRIAARKPLFFDPYRESRGTGAFIVIDPATNQTVGAGMILRPYSERALRGRVTAEERRKRYGHAECVIALPDREELAYALERELFDRGCAVVVGDPAPGLIAIATANPAPVGALTFGDVTDAQSIVEDLERGGYIRPDRAGVDGEGI